MEEDLKKIDRVIIRYLLKEADRADQEFLLNWLKENIANRNYFFALKETWELSQNNLLETAKTDQSWTSLKNAISRQEKDRNADNVTYPFTKIFRFAAAIILIAGLGFALFTLLRKTEAPVTYTEIQTLNGQKKEVTLPDNTKVWLNSGTYFKYPSNYGKMNREVFLQGEAFFDVTRDESKPFIVRADNITIRVLGTSFNVNCYPDMKIVETTVVSGIVSLENSNSIEGTDVVILNKLEKGTYLKDQKKMFIEKDDKDNSLRENSKPVRLKKIALNEEETGYIASWKDQSLSFNNETFDEMAVKLERWFNVSIVIRDENLKHYRYKGKFENVRSVFQVLEVIRLATPITYEYNEKTKEIFIKELKN